jgi:RHS repeat-associated protein
LTTWVRTQAGAVSRYPFLTAKERDNETGLDYFGERYYASTMGRFTTADFLMASGKTSNPQSWNRYVYTLNNPLRYVDPDGLDSVDPWNQLTIEEKRIVERKLVTQMTKTDDGKSRKETSGEAFNRLIGSGTDEEIANKVPGMKNLIDNLGGHENSEAWQDIQSIDSIWLSKNNSVGIELHTANYNGGGGDRYSEY